MLVLEFLLFALSFLLLIPVAVLVIQGLFAMLSYRPVSAALSLRPRIAVLVPAHNEAVGIEQTLNCLKLGLKSGDRLLVVADNCSDDTASLARGAGAEVVERQDLTRRGKGFALDFGIRHLEADPPEVVIVVDADCIVHGNALDLLAQQAVLSGRPVQAMYLMHSPAGAGVKTRIAELAWLVKNKVRPLGFHRLGLPCQLMGTGMALPWKLIRQAHLATGHLVEDLKLGIDLARAGTPPLFCPEALVTSVFPVGETGVQGQRTRWEHGHLGVIVRDGPKLFMEALGGGNSALLPVVLDLCVPPLALLTLLVGGLTGVALILWLATNIAAPLIVSGTAMLCLAVFVLAVWARFGRQVISLSNLAFAPVYALGKIPLYLRFFVNRQVEWVRSQRDAR